MGLHPYQCNHIFVKLPNNQLYDGGKGIHAFNTCEEKDTDCIIIEKSDLEILDKYSWRLIRTYRSCPNFFTSKTSELIAKYLDEIYDGFLLK